MNNKNLMLVRNGAPAKPQGKPQEQGDAPDKALPFDGAVPKQQPVQTQVSQQQIPVSQSKPQQNPTNAINNIVAGAGGVSPEVMAAIKERAAKIVSEASNKVQAGAPVANAPAANAPTSILSIAAPKQVTSIRTPMSLDDLCVTYIAIFRDCLGLTLSSSICFENMRRLCEPTSFGPEGSLYFIENTYRLSTITYLADNFPIIVAASIIAESNRKSIIKYISVEVENGAKPFEELKEIRFRRWKRKYESMMLCDAPSITVGVTYPTKEICAMMRNSLTTMGTALRKFNGELDRIMSKFDTAAKNDVTYIYSNWWYFLQSFENVPEMRNYLMSITDNTKANLKL